MPRNKGKINHQPNKRLRLFAMGGLVDVCRRLRVGGRNETMRELTNAEMCEKANSGQAEQIVKSGNLLFEYEGILWIAHETPERENTAWVWNPVQDAAEKGVVA